MYKMVHIRLLQRKTRKAEQAWFEGSSLYDHPFDLQPFLACFVSICFLFWLMRENWQPLSFVITTLCVLRTENKQNF